LLAWIRRMLVLFVVSYRTAIQVCTATVDFESVTPIRRMSAGRGQHNFVSSWWRLATKNRHVTFESWCERDHLIAFDFDPEILAYTVALPADIGGQAGAAACLGRRWTG
jgi:hypothetical protein